jgi:triacylglycerol esterase/lipase EstA (alpha/beta hydrolase family)
MANIVLAHGILGFGSVLPDQSLNYFNGVKDLYEKKYRHTVLCPTVPALGSIEARAEKLMEQIEEKWASTDGPIFMMAHSMGGLDCRRVIAASVDAKSPLNGQIRRLITIATPHYGSRVADTVLGPFSLLSFSPLKKVFDLFDNDAGALKDLQTRGKLQDATIASGVEYVCVGCDDTRNPVRSKLFAATSFIGGLSGVPNDGVVSLASASLNYNPKSLLSRWAVDHGEAIGWPSRTEKELAEALNTPPKEHLARYEKLLAHLIA